MLLSGISELLSLASALPFFGLLSGAKDFQLAPSPIFSFINLDSNNPLQSLLYSGLVFIVVIIVSSTLRLYTTWLGGRIAASIGSDLSYLAYKKCLYQPYSVHIKRNTSAVIDALSRQVGTTVSTIQTFLQLILSSFIALGLITGLLFVNSFIAIFSSLLLLCSYFLISRLTRPFLISNSEYIARYGKQQVQSIQESFGSIRDILLDSSQETLSYAYRTIDTPLRISRVNNQFLALFPRYLLEPIALISLISLGLFLSFISPTSTILPLLGTIAFGAQRLLPTLQVIYASISSIRAVRADTISVIELLNQPVLPITRSLHSLSFNSSISLRSITFKYDHFVALDNINLTIPKGSILGIIGSTGSGKSTLLDIVMGLLDPLSGDLYVDDLRISQSAPSISAEWRSLVSHVPQSIYLSDQSIVQNITLQSDPCLIDFDHLSATIACSQLAEFIDTLPNGIYTVVGEQGVFLSGGQKQRLGIARALYRKSQLLILDEATSALDNSTEASVIDAICNLDYKPTVIMVAHRLSSLYRCDRLIRVESGRIVASGSPSELLS